MGKPPKWRLSIEKYSKLHGNKLFFSLFDLKRVLNHHNKNKSNAEAWHNPLGPSIAEYVQQIISVTLSHALRHKHPNDPRVKGAWIKARKVVSLYYVTPKIYV